MRRYLITGAAGYVGSMLIKRIKEENPNSEITAAVHNSERFERLNISGVKVIEADLTDENSIKKLGFEYDCIFHCAAITKSKKMIESPVEVIESIVNATQNICRAAMKSSVKSMVYLSSMEVYGKIDCSDGHRVCEDELGDIDIYNVRSCYPMAKRMAENICCCYFKEYNLPVKIARLSQTFGKGILPDENRVFAQFARALADGRDIVLHTYGSSMGNYCGIDDVISALLLILEKGKNGEAYNIVNEDNTMPIRQMAEFAAEKIADNQIGVKFDVPKENIYGYAEDTGLMLSAEKLSALGWKPEKDMLQMYKEVLEELKNRKNA